MNNINQDNILCFGMTRPDKTELIEAAFNYLFKQYLNPNFPDKTEIPTPTQMEARKEMLISLGYVLWNYQGFNLGIHLFEST